MSDKVEVMKQAGQPGEPGGAEQGASAGARSAAMRPKRLVHEEALRLVQQVFLLQNQEPPRVVVFAGIDHGQPDLSRCLRNAGSERAPAGMPP